MTSRSIVLAVGLGLVLWLAPSGYARAEFCGGIYASCPGLCLATGVDLTAEKLKCFLEQGISVDCRYEGLTPLTYSLVWSPDPAVARLLLEYGAHVNERNGQGETALGVAERLRRTESQRANWQVLDRIIPMLRRAGGTH